MKAFGLMRLIWRPSVAMPLLLAVILSTGCSTIPVASDFRYERGEILYEQCNLTVLNTFVLGLYIWSSGCDQKRVPKL
jgi:hypothetical protein